MQCCKTQVSQKNQGSWLVILHCFEEFWRVSFHGYAIFFLLCWSVKDKWWTQEKKGGRFTITVFTKITRLRSGHAGNVRMQRWNRLKPSWPHLLSHLIKLKLRGPMCISETSNIYFLWSWHLLASVSPSACRWLGLSRLRSHSVACKSLWESYLLTECKVHTPHTFPHIAASCDMAAIQRGRPLDRTHHAEQEVGRAPRGRLPPWAEGKQGVWRNLLVLIIPEGWNRIKMKNSVCLLIPVRSRFAGGWREDDGDGETRGLYHQSQERKSGRCCGTPASRCES